MREEFTSNIKHAHEHVVHPELKEIVLHVIEQPGKYIRPQLCYLGASCFDVGHESVLNQAISLELFHAFSLVHDDIMDEAAERRGRPSVYSKYGRDKAILGGDVLMILAYDYLRKELKHNHEDVFRLFKNISIEVCEGQMMDMDFEQKYMPSMDSYIEMIGKKTSVLIGASLQIGALASGASLASSEKLYEFGLKNGIAFQIQDDILDTYGEQKRIGKKRGGDIIRGKKTVLTILACEHNKEIESELLDVLSLDHTEISEQEKIEKVMRIFDANDAKEKAMALRDRYFNEGLSALETLEVDQSKKERLITFMNELKNRIV